MSQYSSSSESTDDDAVEENVRMFNPFTQESYQKLVERELLLKALEHKRNKYAQEAHLVDGELRFGSTEDDDLLPSENLDLKDGSVLTKSYGRFPVKLLGVPIEEIDPSIRNKTFVIISSRSKKKYINRFTATKSLLIFSPWNPVRRATLALTTHQLFDAVIFMTIIINCVFLAMPTQPIAETAEHIFLGIYTLECIIKVVGRGFMFSQHTYMRDPWNWLDFFVISTAFFTLLIQLADPNLSVKDVRGLRTFRVIRALKTVSILPGNCYYENICSVREINISVYHVLSQTVQDKSIPIDKLKVVRFENNCQCLASRVQDVFEVILLTMFCLMIFAIFGLHAYGGALRQKCVVDVTGYIANPSESFSDYYIKWIRNSDHWYKDRDNQYVVCGNSTGAGLCPYGHTCIPNLGDNPRYGFLNFDQFGWAALTSFQLIALDFWEDIYNKIVRAVGPWNVLFFIITTFLGSFYLINLMLAVVSTSYEEEAVRAGKERERDKKESAQKKHNALYDVSYFHLKAKENRSSKIKINPSARSSESDKNQSASQNHRKSIIPDFTDETILPPTFRRISNASNDQLEDESIIVRDPKAVHIIKADVLLNPEVGVLESQVIDRNCDCCEKWMCQYVSFLRMQNYFYMFVSDPLFDFMLTIFIITNTFFMSLEHHDQGEFLTTVLAVADIIFTFAFTMEALCKIIGLGKYYFMHGWNVFDLITVIASLMDVGLQEIDGLNVLRTFRLLRVLKLAQSWPTMRMLVTIILSTIGALGNLCLILCIVTYIFAVIGLQLFRESYIEANFHNDGVPRWNFTDFYHSMLMIFRVLCGEWIEPLYECMRATNEICIVIFLPALILGNFIVLNLFLALLLNAFASDSLDRHLDTSEERSKLADGWNRVKQLILCNCSRTNVQENMNYFSSSENVSVNQSPAEDRSMNAVDAEGNKSDNREMNKKADEAERSKNISNHVIAKEKGNNKFRQKSRLHVMQNLLKMEAYQNKSNNNQENSESLNSACYGMRRFRTHYESLQNNWGMRQQENSGQPNFMVQKNVNIATEINWLNYLADNESWISMRAAGKRIVDNPAFECIVIGIIIGSSITLVFEDIYLYQKPSLERFLLVCNITFAFLFVIEMLLKFIGLGFTEYFTNIWTLLDFAIVVISILSLIGDATGASNIAAFRSLRTFRAFRPLRAVSKWQGMKIVVNALMNAIPAIMNVFLVCMMFWLIFSIMGVQFFKGRFFRCVNVTGNYIFHYTDVPDRNTCYYVNGSWENPNVNFDTAANGFLALFQVATFEGWMEVMADAVDSVGVDKQPRYEANLYSYLYFVVFIVIGSFFSLNLFIGVIIDNFNVLKKKYEGSYLDAFLTQGQRNYYNTLKRMINRKPKKIIQRPQNRFQLCFYDLAVSSRFEMSIVIFIFLNMVAMGVTHYSETILIFEMTRISNIMFTCIFTLEALVKLIGLRLHYFRFAWNVFDFSILLLTLVVLSREIIHSLDLAPEIDYILINITVMPSLLRILRVFHMGRVLRLVKAAKGIRKLLFAIIISLPAVFNIGVLLFMIMFIYAIIGMSSFGSVKINGVFTEILNFQTFGNSFMLLLRLSTAAGWNDVLEALLIDEPDCNLGYYTMPDGYIKYTNSGDCGIPYLAIPFMVSYIILVWLIVVNMYIAVLLENFSQAHVQEEVGITEDDFDMFYTVWEKYDPFATQFIKYEQLGDLVGNLDPPLQISKPNEIALVSFNIPILEGEKMHCVDILLALVKNVLKDIEDSEEIHSLKMQMEVKFSQNFSSRMNITVKSTSLQRKKEDVAARTLQRSWRSYKAQKAMLNITAYAQKQKHYRATHSGNRMLTSPMSDLSNRLSIAMDKFFHFHRDLLTGAGKQIVIADTNKITFQTN